MQACLFCLASALQTSNSILSRALFPMLLKPGHSNMCTCPLQRVCKPAYWTWCRLVEESSTYSHPQLLKHIHVGTGVGILKALISVHEFRGQWNAASVTPKQRRDLRDYLLHVSVLPIPKQSLGCNVPSGPRQGVVCALPELSGHAYSSSFARY